MQNIRKLYTRELLSFFWTFKSDRLKGIEILASYGDVVEFGFPGQRYYMVNDPELVGHILTRTNGIDYDKGSDWRVEVAKQMFGDGLLTSIGDEWLQQRRLSSRTFHHTYIANLASKFTSNTEEMLMGWEGNYESGEPLDIVHEMKYLALDNIAEFLFGSRMGPHDIESIIKASDTASSELGSYLCSPFSFLPFPVPTPGYMKFKSAVRELDRIVEGIIHEKSQGVPVEDGSLLSILREACDEETNVGKNQIHDQVKNALIAGYGSSALVLIMTLYQISQNPEVYSSLMSELNHQLGGRNPTASDYGNLQYTRNTINECMRKDPPGWLIMRVALKDDNVNGYHIPKGTNLILSPYVMHHNAKYWKNPEEINPDHFNPDSPDFFMPNTSQKRSQFAYFPFGGGSHICIGKPFFEWESAMVIPTIEQKYKLDLIPGQEIILKPFLILEPKGQTLMIPRTPYVSS